MGELKGLKETLDLELQSEWRVKEANKKFFQQGVKTFYCEICYCDLPLNEISILECGHYFCRECLKGYFDYMINKSGSSHMLKCANQTCKYKVEEKYVKDICGDQSHKKFLKFMGDYQVRISKNKKFCPNPGCETVNEFVKGKKQTKCVGCQKDFCYKC